VSVSGVGAAVEVVPSGPVVARLRAPASKSVTNRLLVLAALADGVSVLEHPLDSDDSQAMRRVVRGLGIEVEEQPGGWRVTGGIARLRAPGAPLDAGLSGTTMRFGSALAALAPGPATVTGLPPLLRRPVGPLVRALDDLGAGARDRDGLPPVTLDGGGLDGGAVTVDATRSSQFASAVLLVAPHARRDVHLRVAGETALAYVALTADLLREWGADITADGDAAWRVRAGTGYRPRRVAVEYDASAAAHLLALAVATGGAVTVVNARMGSGQPDADLPGVLARMGATTAREGDALTVTGPDLPAPVDVDLRAMPDMVTTVAALAALAPGTSRITGVAVARTHETDRLAALAAELGKLGVEVAEQPDGLVVRGGSARGPARLSTHDDHRLAMAFAAVAARVPGVVVEDPGCVAKTYPEFWADLRSAGVTWRPVA